MSVLNLIKKKCTIRKYQGRALPKATTEKIIAAGLWSSSVHGFQPWRFVAVTDISVTRKISYILQSKSKTVRGGMDKLLNFSAEILRNAPLLVVVYNSQEFTRAANKFFKIEKSYISIAKMTEIEAISGAMQNMIVVAASMGIGSCWITTSLFCAAEIVKLLDIDGELIGILTFGYPAEKGERSIRRNASQVVKYI